jgi:hypothetical protein
MNVYLKKELDQVRSCWKCERANSWERGRGERWGREVGEGGGEGREGESENDLTPAMWKWLPNNYPKEQAKHASTPLPPSIFNS